MSRFFVPEGSVSAGKITVRGEELHHARDVMRVREGDEITVFDGTGKEYRGIVSKIGRDELYAAVKKVSDSAPDRCRLTLVQAVPKFSTMDLIIEKATELGVSRIVPVVTERTVVKAESGGGRHERWKKIAVVAAKQCGRATFPEITAVTGFRDSLSQVKGNDICLIPCLYEGNRPVKEALKDRKAASAAVFIGPEGDFTKEEVALAAESGVMPVTLGSEVLRSETASIAALAILSYELRW